MVVAAFEGVLEAPVLLAVEVGEDAILVREAAVGAAFGRKGEGGGGGVGRGGTIIFCKMGESGERGRSMKERRESRLYSAPSERIANIKKHAGRIRCVKNTLSGEIKPHPAPANRSARPLVDANLDDVDDDDATPATRDATDATRGSRALRAAADANIVWVYGVLFVRASRRRLGSAFGLKAKDG